MRPHRNINQSQLVAARVYLRIQILNMIVFVSKFAKLMMQVCLDAVENALIA